jgi:hypothetical protein
MIYKRLRRLDNIVVLYIILNTLPAGYILFAHEQNNRNKFSINDVDLFLQNGKEIHKVFAITRYLYIGT